MNIPEWITKYWLEWVFGIGIALLTWLYKRLSGQVKKEREEQQALRDGMRSLLMRQIQIDCENAIKEAACPVPVKQSITAMYDSYHALGGNGVITELYNQTIKLPTVQEAIP